MEFKLDKATNVATSDCGFYTISGALNNGRMWWNARYLPAQRSIEASYDKDQCKKVCAEHEARIAKYKQPEPQYDLIKR